MTDNIPANPDVSTSSAPTASTTQIAGPIDTEFTGRIEVKFPKRSSVYFSVTEAEINIYAQLGWAATIFLTLSGVFIGVAAGALISLQQSGIPQNGVIVLTAVAVTTGIVAAIFFLLAAASIFLQAINRKAWEPTKETNKK